MTVHDPAFPFKTSAHWNSNPGCPGRPTMHASAVTWGAMASKYSRCANAGTQKMMTSAPGTALLASFVTSAGFALICNYLKRGRKKPTTPRNIKIWNRSQWYRSFNNNNNNNNNNNVHFFHLLSIFFEIIKEHKTSHITACKISKTFRRLNGNFSVQ